MSAEPRPAPEERAGWALLCAFVFSLPWEKSVWVPGVGTISRLLGLLAVAAAAIAVARRRSVRGPNLALALAALFVLWTGLTYFWSIAPQPTSARFFTFAQLLVMVWLIWEWCRTPGRQAQLIAAYAAGTLLSAAGTLVRYAQSRQTYYRRYAAAGFDPNDLGLTVALSIPLALYLALRGRGLMRWLCYAAIPAAIAVVLLTASRTALIASLVAFAFALWTWRDSDRVHKIASAVLLGLLVLGAVLLAPPASRERLATLPAELRQGTLHSRTRIWKTGLKVFRQRPVRGVGGGAFPLAVRPWLGAPPVAGHEYVAHNTYLSVLVEYGLVGFGLFALLLATLALFVWMMPLAERALWSVVLVAWAVGVSTLTWEYRKPGWLIFGLIMTEWARSFYPRTSAREDPCS